MAFSERLRLVLDLDGNTFGSKLKGIRTEMAATDGLFGKMKVGARGLGDAFGAAAKSPAVLGAAVVGVGAAALAAVNKFADLALEVGRMSDATGIATPALSRMLEVTGDIGIQAGSVEKTLGFMNKTAGKTPEVFAELGAAIAKDKDGLTDVNATFLNVVDTLNSIRDPAKKAAAAQALLGRGWKEMAELIGQGSTEIRESLKGVSEAKVIDPAEVAQAREFRDAMDELKDKFEDLALSAGQKLIPVLTTVVKLMSAVSDGLDDLSVGSSLQTPEEFEEMTDKGLDLSAAVYTAREAFLALQQSMRQQGLAETERETRELTSSLDALAGGTNTWESYLSSLNTTLGDTDRETRRLTGAMGTAEDAVSDVTYDVAAFTQALTDTTNAYKTLTEQISGERTWLELKGDLEAANAAITDGTLKGDEQRKTLLDLKDAAIAYGEANADIPREVITDIVADIDQGKLDEATWKLAELEKQRNVKVFLDTAAAMAALNALSARWNGIAAAFAKGLGSNPGIDPKTGRPKIDSAPSSDSVGNSVGNRRGEGMPSGFAAGSGADLQGLTLRSTPAVVADAKKEAAAVEESAEDKLAAEAELLRMKLYYGDITREQFIAGLRAQTEGLDRFSRYAFEITREADDKEREIRDEKATAIEKATAEFEAAEERRRRALEETAALEERIAAEAEAARRRRRAEQEEEVDNEETIRAQARAVDELAWAQAQLEKVMRDRKATDEDRARAIKDVEAAQEKLARATVAGAAARANQEAFADGSDEYYAFIKKAIDDYIAAHPELTGAAREILTGGAARAATPQSAGPPVIINNYFGHIIGDDERVGQIVSAAVTQEIRRHGPSFLAPK